MDAHEIHKLLAQVKAGRVSRRSFVQTLVGLGLTAPMAAQLLPEPGIAWGQQKSAGFAPTRRGGGGRLRLLWWQAPTLLNPHLSVGTTNSDGLRIFYEPLAAFDPDGNLVPVLAEEIPSDRNGGVGKDGRSVVWRLKKGVTWHDGRPFTADDVIFNWEYAVDPATAAASIGSYSEIEKVDKLDSHTVKVSFGKPTPFWAEPFCGRRTLIPKHLFEPYKGAKSREAPTNLKPIGTGPYRCVEFKPGDTIRAELNTAYHVPNRPFFDTLELKGGGDAVSAARAVLQTGEYDYAWNLQVEDDVLNRLERGGRGRVDIIGSGNIEHIQCNSTDPWTEIDGERSSVKAPHPLLTDPAVRQALSLLVDRAAIQENVYGRTGIVTANYLNLPPRFASKNTRWEFNVDKANQLLDGAGWKRGADGVRAKDGKRLKLVFQTSINSLRQKTQAIVKQSCAKAGIEIEIKSVVASVFFSSDPANPDTNSHFYSDIQMYAIVMTAPDPRLFMRTFASWSVAAKANKWQERNVTRWRNDEYDRTFLAAETELDPVKRAALFIKLNDLVIQNVVVIPVVLRSQVAGVSLKLRDVAQSAWDSDFWRLPYWYREA
jgi:peptide/nickel transport system substrate-binding protein